MGELANVAQLTGVDAVRLIGMIVRAASTARMHKKNCRQFAQHLKLIGNLLEQLKISELKKYPETREPLEQLEDALRRSYILVNSCQDRSYLYLLAMGWNIVYQFRKAQNEIDRYLRLVPLITLVDNARVRVPDTLLCSIICYPIVVNGLFIVDHPQKKKDRGKSLWFFTHWKHSFNFFDATDQPCQSCIPLQNYVYIVYVAILAYNILDF